MDQFTKEGRKLRPRKSAAGSAATSERVEYHPGERKSYGESRGSYGEHRNNYGERRSGYGENRGSYGENRGSYGENRGGYGHNNGERRSYGAGRYSNNSDRPSYGSERRSYGDRPSYGDKPSYNNDRRSYGDRPSYNSGERPANGERHSYGDRPANGERRPFGSSPARSGRPTHNSRPGFGGKPSFGRRSVTGKSFANRGKRLVKSENEGINRMINRRPVINGNEAPAEEYPGMIKDVVRLNKFIANSGVCSRRAADTLIQAGVVTVNGQVVTELGTKVNIYEDDIRFNGERLKGEDKVYIVMNKPKGFVTTASDPHAEKTVLDLVKNCKARVYPVGRLDKNTTGVLMLTNDGEMAERLTHPSYDKKKIYQVTLDRVLSQEDYDKILNGIELSDGEVKADELEYVNENDKRELGIEIHSGKNRIVRRIFESLGYTVKSLDRVYFAGLTKKGLKKGEWRYLTEGESNILKMGAYI